jgi:hypothetical protein
MHDQCERRDRGCFGAQTAITQGQGHGSGRLHSSPLVPGKPSLGSDKEKHVQTLIHTYVWNGKPLPLRINQPPKLVLTGPRHNIRKWGEILHRRQDRP